MLNQILLKLNKKEVASKSYEIRLSILTSDELNYLAQEVKNFNKQLNKGLTRNFMIFLQRRFLVNDNAYDLLDYLKFGIEEFIPKFDKVLSDTQKESVSNLIDEQYSKIGFVKYTDKTGVSANSLDRILLFKYKTREAVDAHKAEVKNRLTTQTCLANYGKRRFAGNSSHDHMMEMNKKRIEWEQSLSGDALTAFKKKRSDSAKSANARFTPEERLAINERNRLSNIRNWNSKSEEEKQKIRERNAKNGMLSLQHPKMNAGSKRNTAFHESLLSALNIDAEREFPIYFDNNSHCFKYDFRVGNILIDINPVETHNSSISFVHLAHKCTEENCTKHPPESSRYHFNRWKVARDNGYELISIFDWMDAKSVIDFISYKIGKATNAIGARKCDIRKVAKEDAVEFVKTNHLLGFPPTKNIYAYGLYNEDTLVSLLILCKPRYKKDAKYDYELLRFVSNMKVSGGLQKLWKYAVTDLNPKSVLTYTDNNFGNGFIYKSIGFKELSIESPTCYWEHLRYPQYKFQSKVLAYQGADIVIKNYVQKMGKEYFRVGMDFEDYVRRGGREFYHRPNDSADNWIGNEDIARFYDFVKIYDCGNTRWSWQL